MELCCHLSSGPTSKLPGVGPGKQLGDLFPRASRRGAEGLYKDGAGGADVAAEPTPDPAGSTRGSTGGWRLVLCQGFLERNLFPLLNQSMLIKEMGLNIEKYREQEKGTPSTITRSPVTLCFCLY